jgi:murein DD-endopeptidase MepM/ murein hydrolase activator NlpD
MIDCRYAMDFFQGGMEVYSVLVRISEWSRKHREGSITLEHVVLFPLFIILSLVVWQLILSGMAVMDTHAAVRDAVRVASTTGDTDKAEEQGKNSFGKSGSYKLKRLDVKIEKDEAIAKAEVEIPILFMASKPITYETEEKAPALNTYNFANPIILGGGQLGLPVPNATNVSSNFGPRTDPVYGGTRNHNGIDIPGPIGTPIYAAGDGIVKYAGPASGYGYLIIIDHGGGLETWYAHMYPYQVRVFTGQQVKRGQQIAEIGNNGKSTGPHLHFEVRSGGVPVNPMPFLSG